MRSMRGIMSTDHGRDETEGSASSISNNTQRDIETVGTTPQCEHIAVDDVIVDSDATHEKPITTFDMFWES